jgi:hypothetical protein
MPARTSPENGDVLVRQETRDGTVVYILRTAPGTDQYLLRTRADAVVQAVTFAERHGVRAWLLEDGDHCVPLTNGRMAASVGVKRERRVRGAWRPAGG